MESKLSISSGRDGPLSTDSSHQTSKPPSVYIYTHYTPTAWTRNPPLPPNGMEVAIFHFRSGDARSGSSRSSYFLFQTKNRSSEPGPAEPCGATSTDNARRGSLQLWRYQAPQVQLLCCKVWGSRAREPPVGRRMAARWGKEAA